MVSFNVLSWDFNTKKVVPYDVIPHLVNVYGDKKLKFTKLEEFKEFIVAESRYQWWSRCEYEIVVGGFPPQGVEHKLDVHYQVMMNLDTIATLLMKTVL